MASLSYIVHVLATLFNPISLLLYGHHHQYYSSTSIEHDQSNKVALFVFGDSLFEAGNNGYLPNATAETDPATAWPYGETFFHYSTGRFTDGRIVPDFIGTYTLRHLSIKCYLHCTSWGSREQVTGVGRRINSIPSDVDADIKAIRREH